LELKMNDISFFDGNATTPLFYSIPIPILVLNKQLEVYEANWAAKILYHQGTGFQQERSCGETIHCLYRFESRQPHCHTLHCSDCIIRSAVNDVLFENRVVRKKSQIYIQQDKFTYEVSSTMTSWLVVVNGIELAMVMMEELTDLFQLGQILPMCAVCKKIKTSDDNWENVETYISRHLGSDASHGICPECRNRLYPELEDSL
jgi:hypothetical protein